MAVSCSSCFLKLSMLQKQTEKIEKMLFCIKKTLNFKEACLYMGLSRSQLYKLAKSGHIPTTDRPANCCILTSRVDEWLCRNQVEETEENCPKEMPDSMNECVEPDKQFAS